MPTSVPTPGINKLADMSSLVAAQANTLRNVANVAELKTWIKNLAFERLAASSSPRDVACRKWLGSVGQNWVLRKGAILLYAPTPEELHAEPAWVAQAVASETALHKLRLSSSEREALRGVLDWMRSDDGPSLDSDWSKISVEQGLRSEREWVDERVKAASKKDLEAADAIGSELFAPLETPGPDGRHGWRWVAVKSPDALDREGALMRHCVGSYATDVAAGSKQVFSLRNPDNKPLLTIESQQGELLQLKAFANGACPASLAAAVAVFADAFSKQCAALGWEPKTASELEAAGVVAVPGLGLANAGAPIPAQWEQLVVEAFSRDDGPEWANALLPSFASLGWIDLATRALPLADQAACDKALAHSAARGDLAMANLLLPFSDPLANSSEALAKAAEHCHISMARLLLPLSEPKAASSIALCWAAARGDIAMIELLLPLSDPMADDSQALRFAAEHGHLKAVQLLAPFSEPLAEQSQALKMAGLRGHADVVEFLLPFSGLSDDASKTLACAAGEGHANVVRLLLRAGVKDGSNDFRALAAAAERGQAPVVHLLLEAESSADAIALALAAAAKGGRMPIVELLLPLADPKAHGSPALIDAAAGGSLEAVKRLAPLSEPDRLGEAFLAAAQHGRMDVARWLLPFCDPLANDSQALREAARNGKVEMVEMLLPLSDPQAKNSQALRLALAEGDLEVAILLKKAIASINRVAQSGPPDNSPTHPAIPEKLHSRREQNAADLVFAQGLPIP